MKQYVDLSHMLEPGMPTLPFCHHPLTEFVQTNRIGMEGSCGHKVTFGTHTGTHIDSPKHMLQYANQGVDEIELERLIGPAKLLRLKKAQRELIEPEDLEMANLQPGDRLLLSTGWSEKWGSKAFFFNFPSFSKDAVNYLVEKRVGMIGIDTPAPEPMGLPDEDPNKN